MCAFTGTALFCSKFPICDGKEPVMLLDSNGGTSFWGLEEISVIRSSNSTDLNSDHKC